MHGGGRNKCPSVYGLFCLASKKHVTDFAGGFHDSKEKVSYFPATAFISPSLFLFSFAVRKAQLVGASASQSTVYVTLKLQVGSFLAWPVSRPAGFFFWPRSLKKFLRGRLGLYSRRE